MKVLEADQKKETEIQGTADVNKLKKELEDATPVDTGLARASWEIKKSTDFLDLHNTVDYIEKLNEGSSKQAPTHFIESIALKYGVPLGTIVNKAK